MNKPKRTTGGKTKVPRGESKMEPVDDGSAANAAGAQTAHPLMRLAKLLGDVENNKGALNVAFKELIQSELDKHPIASKYHLLFLFDDTSLVSSDADLIYRAITKFDAEGKDLLLILSSDGGSPAAGYFISKLCKERAADSRFVVAVPRRAKSAATLICCGASEIHMGSLSELGPIDPQIDGLPVLGLKNSIEHVADLVSRYPRASEMFASYMSKGLPIINLGHYERVAESAEQYATRLLTGFEPPRKAKEIAKRLVHEYKDHGFVIDRDEATEIFGDHVVKRNTPEYELANSVYDQLSFVKALFEIANYGFYFIGSIESEPQFQKRQSKRARA